MIIETTRFGELSIEEESVITFVSPILGFADMMQYFQIEPSENSPFQYLQSIDDPDLTFVLVNPFLFYPEYEFELEEKWIEKLEIKQKEDVMIKVITTLKSSKDITVNLKAPVVINARSNKAAQIVLEQSKYNTRHSLLAQSSEEGK